MPFDKTSEQWIPWNKGKLVGQKSPLKPQQVWAIRVRLQLARCSTLQSIANYAVATCSACASPIFEWAPRSAAAQK